MATLPAPDTLLARLFLCGFDRWLLCFNKTHFFKFVLPFGSDALRFHAQASREKLMVSWGFIYAQWDSKWPLLATLAIYPSFFSACFKHDCFSSDGSVFPSVLISPVPFHEQQGGGVYSVTKPIQTLPVLQDKHRSKTAQLFNAAASQPRAKKRGRDLCVLRGYRRVIIALTCSGSVTSPTVDQQL